MKSILLINELNKKNLKVFTVNDLRRLFPKDAKNMGVIVSRLVKNKFIVPVYRGIYRLENTDVDIEMLAEQIYYPSYISFESALFKYGIIDQGPFTITLATTRHSKKISLGNIECEYRKLSPALFFGFNLINGVYIAEAEKAILDTFYFIYLGKIKTDYKNWYLKEINKEKLRKYAKLFSNSFFEFVSKKI